MFGKKYKLSYAGKQNPRSDSDPKFRKRVYRLKALRDIPEHGVKKDDLGGLVTNRDLLNHKGSCWIGYGAEVFGSVYISEDVYIGDNATVHHKDRHSGYTAIAGKARITGNAIVEVTLSETGYRRNGLTYISDSVQIYGNARLTNVHKISGNAKIYGDAILNEVKEVTDNAEIFGKAFLDFETIVIGDSKIHGSAHLKAKSTVRNSDLSGNVVVPKYEIVGESVIADQTQLKLDSTIHVASETKAITSKKSRTLALYSDIKERIASYETDIVKIIKYPTMTDRSVPSTLDMTMASSKVSRLMEDGCDETELAKAVQDLEVKFFIAESNALKIASTTLSESELKKVETARNLLAIAADDASSENEKKQSFKQAFKQLEGVLAVPEIAVDTFRVKIGLKELEA